MQALIVVSEIHSRFFGLLKQSRHFVARLAKDGALPARYQRASKYFDAPEPAVAALGCMSMDILPVDTLYSDDIKRGNKCLVCGRSFRNRKPVELAQA